MAVSHRIAGTGKDSKQREDLSKDQEARGKICVLENYNQVNIIEGRGREEECREGKGVQGRWAE